MLNDKALEKLEMLRKPAADLLFTGDLATGTVTVFSFSKNER
jgi:hypothetical protein